MFIPQTAVSSARQTRQGLPPYATPSGARRHGALVALDAAQLRLPAHRARRRNPKSIQQQLGHATITVTITYDVYDDGFRLHDEHAADDLATGLLGNNVGNARTTRRLCATGADVQTPHTLDRVAMPSDAERAPLTYTAHAPGGSGRSCTLRRRLTVDRQRPNGRQASPIRWQNVASAWMEERFICVVVRA
jgi:hypothetical protein